MNLKNNKNNWYKLLLCALYLLTCFAACKKVEEPARPVGQQLPYKNSKKNLQALIDSIPEASFFKIAFKRSALQAYMDSLSAGNKDAPYTFFVPTNQAFTNAGYTQQKLSTMPVPEINLLLGYLILPGNLNNTSAKSLTAITLYPLVHPDPHLERTTPSVFYDGLPYYYALTVGFSDNALLLNGKKVKESAIAFQATDGTVLMTDSVVKMPVYEIYQALDADTSLSFFMAAMRKSNDIYNRKGLTYSVRYNDTTWMMLNNSPTYQGAGSLPFAIVFAPVNNAFRKAGIRSVRDVEAYIDKSDILNQPDYTEMLTNMDSILVNHRFLSGYSNVNVGLNYLYTPDLTHTPVLSDAVNLGSVTLQNINGSIVLHRQDAPNGRAAKIIPVSDITTLNGVVHHVDNLMLPTP